MRNLYKSKLMPVLIYFFRAAPLLFLASLGCRLFFILLQMASIWIVFSWVSGSVNAYFLEIVGQPADSYIYPGVGAAGLIGSTCFSLLSKMLALESTYKFEAKIVERNSSLHFPLTKGDLRNIVKLMISVLDIIIPLMLIVIVACLWTVITPYTLLIVGLVLFIGAWASKQGVKFSANSFKNITATGRLNEYIGGHEHRRFYKILLLPNYVSLVIISMVSVSVALSLVATKIYFTSHGMNIGHMAIITGVAFLQMKSFAGIIVRAGAYNKSLSVVHNIISAA
ncbi:MAG: hypothetical protein NC238_10185 [Dehalobacter sp.]|nr:hypothetical protein [Dehalobacter sp.]